MKVLIVILCISCVLGKLAIEKKFGDELKKKATWQVANYEDNVFRFWSIEEVKQLLGIKNKQQGVEHKRVNLRAISTGLPTNFDARQNWSGCANLVRDQIKCGSCWAMAITSHLSDRFCANKRKVVLSPQYLLECDKYDSCCNGGDIDSSFRFITETGTVEESCLPYDMKCGKCRDEKCPHFKCKKGSLWTSSDEARTKQEIYSHGPVESTMDVYQDFYYYREGVYSHVSGDFLGAHAIEVIGWGSERGQNYWLCKNSWGSQWGMGGFFKIKIGECDVDTNMIACAPDI